MQIQLEEEKTPFVHELKLISRKIQAIHCEQTGKRRSREDQAPPFCAASAAARSLDRRAAVRISLRIRALVLRALSR